MAVLLVGVFMQNMRSHPGKRNQSTRDGTKVVGHPGNVVFSGAIVGISPEAIKLVLFGNHSLQR